jgi:hypothetical protein
VGERASALERQGIDVVHLEFGEPDFEAPLVVREALEKAIKDGRTRYTHSLGIVELRDAIVEHYARSYGVSIDREQVMVTAGTSPAMLLLFGHLLDPGDEVILSNPYYACYPNFIRYADGVPVEVDVAEGDRFQYRPEAIGARLTSRTRAILVNSPANPTGSVLAADRMAAIAGLAAEAGPFIVSDEIYHGLTDGGRDRSMLEFTDRAFVLNGFSKAFAMTGWRSAGSSRPPRTRARSSVSMATSSSRPTSSSSGPAWRPCGRRPTTPCASGASSPSDGARWCRGSGRSDSAWDSSRRAPFMSSPTCGASAATPWRSRTRSSSTRTWRLPRAPRSAATPRVISAFPTLRRSSASRKVCAASATT